MAVARGGRVVYTARGLRRDLAAARQSTLLGVGRLGYEGQLVEIEAVPVLD